MTTGAPALPTTVIALWQLSDSFAAVWPALEEEFGVAVVATPEADQWLHQSADIRLVAAGGAEREAGTRLASLPRKPGGSVAVVGAEPDHRLAMAIVKAGADEYFVVPEDIEQLRSWLKERIDEVEQAEQQRTFTAREEAKYRFDGLIGSSPALHAAMAVAARVIPRPTITVLITGESGTGKELIARAIHYNGPRKGAPFVDINCAAIPEQLLESELFGHEKGAFTHATAAKPGLFEVANGGTLFLDEIGHLPLQLQGKLLRALEQRTIRRLGGSTSLSVDVRVIAATHVLLPEAVRRGDFREDLYYRLNVLPIDLPPLRSRDNDVLQLARHFLARFAADYGMPCPALTAAALQRLRSHSWPGNVRELRNVIERSLLLAKAGDLDADDLTFRTTAPTKSPSDLPFPGTMRELIRGAAAAMLEQCQGNKSEAARRLAISRTRLLRLLDSSRADSLDEDDL